MNMWTMNHAVNEAKETLKNADEQVGVMANLCAGRLRRAGVKCNTLEILKRELRDYNIHTGEWKNEP